MRISKTWVLVLIVVVLTVMPVSPILYFLGVNGTQLFVFISLVVSFIFILAKKYPRNSVESLIFALPVLASYFPAIYWGDYRYIILPLLYLPSVFIFSRLRRDQILLYIELISTFAIVLLLCAILGSATAIAGMNSLKELTMGDGRSTFIYMFTLTNVVVGNVIRPSGIFDEPGALSFFICFVVVIREVAGFSRRHTVFMLLGGLVTLSLAHLLFIVCYLLHVKKIKILFFSLLFCIAAYFFLKQIEIFGLNELFFNRLDVSEGGISGNNRGDMFDLALKNINVESFFWGLNPTCIFNRTACHSVYGYMGENPLAPLVFSGFFISFYYYFGLLYLLYIALSKKDYRFIYLGFVLLFLQRPYMLTLGYSMMFAALIYVPHVCQISRRASYVGKSIASWRGLR